jgi:hypothetical protein
MGNFWENSKIKRDEVINNISQINEITKTLIFMKKLKIYLIFNLDDNTLMKRNSHKIIKVIIYDYDDSQCFVQKRKHSLSITIEDFYKYFNLLMNLRSMFLSEQMKQKLRSLSKSKIDSFGEDESGICPICSENKVNLSLPCSHFFCDKCIKTWILKSESCPLCRCKLKKNKSTDIGVDGVQSWNIVDEVDEEQIEKENMEFLQILTRKLFIVK